MRLWMRWSAWLCLSLMVWTAAAESAHTHPNRTEAASCSLCVVAHSANPTVSAHRAAPVLQRWACSGWKTLRPSHASIFLMLVFVVLLPCREFPNHF